MNDPLRLRALNAVSMYMGHHIVADQLLLSLCHLIINVILVGFQFVDLLLGDRQSQFLLRLRQRDPQPPPGPKLLVR